MGAGRAAPQIATLLDRTAWLLARHAGLWLDLSADDHEFLASQPAPYAAFFAALERVVHDHGPLAMAALIEELERDADAQQLGALLGRLRGFHEVDDEDPPALVAAVLHRLRQRAVDDELQWLIESGAELSQSAIERRNALFALRAEMKNSQAGPAARQKSV
jgi:DNA primase